MPRDPQGKSEPPRRLRYPILASAISLSLANLLPIPVKAATINVDGSACTLIEAITTANSNTPVTGCTTGSGPDTIVLQNSSVHSLSTVNNSTDGNNGLPSITSSITIQGNGATIERVSGPTYFRLLHIADTGNLTLNNVTLSGAGTSPFSSSFEGGAIFNRGTVTLNNSTVSGNSADYGGGLYNRSGSVVTLNNSTISNNDASVNGGGMNNSSSTVTLNASTVSGNTAYRAGGISNGFSTVTLSNSTISDNRASYSGGGMRNSFSTVTLTNSTVSGNRADYGGGLYNQLSSNLTLKNTIVANSTFGGDCFNNGSTITANNTNIIEDGSCGTSALAIDPNLGPLANNGGPTKTQALLAGSGAIDAGDNAVCAAAPVSGKDQRAVTRPQGVACDIGAYEATAGNSTTDDSILFVIPLPGGKSITFDL